MSLLSVFTVSQIVTIFKSFFGTFAIFTKSIQRLELLIYLESGHGGCLFRQFFCAFEYPNEKGLLLLVF